MGPGEAREATSWRGPWGRRQHGGVAGKVMMSPRGWRRLQEMPMQVEGSKPRASIHPLSPESRKARLERAVESNSGVMGGALSEVRRSQRQVW